LPSIFFYISGHGFGHSIRQIEIINALLRMAPDLPILVRTNAAAWLFGRTVRGNITLLPGDIDPGVVQIDGLRLDERATVERARDFYAALPSRAEEEAARLQAGRAALVVADAPPLACAAAHLAGIPSVVCANFTWDWIYAGYRDAADVDQLVARLQAAYALADAAWRLPMHGGFASFATVVDVPFVARHARSDRTRDRIRIDLHLPETAALALISFGGYGIRDLPIDRLDCLDEWHIVLTAPRAQLAGVPVGRGVHCVPEELLYERGLRYEDLVKAVDVVVTKPGYGIISDCLANGTPMLYTSRGRFAEYDVLVREMPDVLRCGFLEMDAFLEGRWRAGLDAVMSRSAPRVNPRTDGAEQIARMIVDRLHNPAAKRGGGGATT
jgi:L-arabinokinase